MTERERLIQILDDAKIKALGTLGSMNEGFGAWYADRLLEAGVIVPPCKVGDTVYCIRYDKARNPFVKALEVRTITTFGINKFLVFTTKDDTWGTMAFATEEEAEKALKERSEGK